MSAVGPHRKRRAEADRGRVGLTFAGVLQGVGGAANFSADGADSPKMPSTWGFQIKAL